MSLGKSLRDSQETSPIIASVMATIDSFRSATTQQARAWGRSEAGIGAVAPLGDALETPERLSPSATVDRMIRVERQSIQADMRAETAQLDEPLRGGQRFRST
jgi:hypothetical protein